MMPVAQLLESVPQPICGVCLGALLADREPRFMFQLEELQREHRVELALDSCTQCGETAPTYRLAA